MSFISDRPIAKITSAFILGTTTLAYVLGVVPEPNTDVLTVLIGGSMGFLFGTSVKN